MRKIISVVLTILFLLTFSVASTASEVDRNQEVIFEAKEIKDMNLIKKRMKQGITDDKNLKIKSHIYGDLIVEKNGKKYELVKKSISTTSQKLKEVKTRTGNKADLVATTIVEYGLKPVNDVKQNTFTIQGVGSSFENNYDSYPTWVEQYMTTYYTYKDPVEINSVSGTSLQITKNDTKLVRLDSQIVLQNIKSQIKYKGDLYSDIDCTNFVTSTGFYPLVYEEKFSYVSSDQFYPHTVSPNYFVHLEPNVVGGIAMAQSWGTVVRGTSSQTLYTEFIKDSSF